MDSLAVVGSPILDSNLINFVTDDLGHDYKEFITSLHACQITRFDELYDLTIQEEHFLKKMSFLTLSTDVSLVANHTSNTTNINSRGNSNFYQCGSGGGRYKGRGG